MSDTETRDGFTGDPAAAQTATGGGGCCGNPPQAVLAVPEPATTAATDGPTVSTVPSPCCGTRAEAAAEGSCCGSTAKSEAVAAGQGCCG